MTPGLARLSDRLKTRLNKDRRNRTSQIEPYCRAMGHEDIILGIDLGTTFSSAAAWISNSVALRAPRCV